MLIVGQDANMISKLKEDLSKSFDMKDLGRAMDQKNKKLWLSQQKYVELVLAKFNMKNAKPASAPLASHFKLIKKDCPQSKGEKLEMSKISYASTVGSIMYAMGCA